MTARSHAAFALAALAVLPACALRPRPPQVVVGGGGSPFAPVAIQIHPLTHVEGDGGATSIIAHVEMRDAWGDTVKGTGDLQLQLYRPESGRAAGLGTQELVWDIDLNDLEQNAAFYDPATRTYRLPLLDAPAWVADAAASAEAPGALLRVVLTAPGPKGEPRMLEDEYVVE